MQAPPYFQPLKRHLQFAAEDNCKFCHFFKKFKSGIIFHENCLLADDSHVIPYLIFVKNWERCCKICSLLQL